MKAYVPYVVTGELVVVDLPGWGERHLWWPLARRMPEWCRLLLWRLWHPKLPTDRVAGWLITHTPWWGGPGIARPHLYEHIVGEPW